MNAHAPLNWTEARDLVRNAVSKIVRSEGSERVSLPDAYRRVLAEDVAADRDYPALRRSLRDGFAVHAADTPGKLQIRGERRAGDPESSALAPGEALEIMTGAPVPAEADAVVMVEHVKRSGDVVEIAKAAEPGEFINPQGAEAKAGQTLIERGTALDGSHVATLAMTGTWECSVSPRPRVAILATGDEIVPVEAQPAPHQIRNSNSYMLAALVAGFGGIPTVLPVAPDTRDGLSAMLAQGFEHDMLLVSGGVSAGKYDLVKPCLRELGVDFAFERVKIQPGQPTAFGIKGQKPIFGLPGNPGSTLVTFQLFARLALELIAGRCDARLPVLDAVFAAPFRHKPGLTRFLPAFLEEDGRSLRHIPWRGSSDIPALAKANVFLIADEKREVWQPGHTIPVMPKP